MVWYEKNILFNSGSYIFIFIKFITIKWSIIINIGNGLSINFGHFRLMTALTYIDKVQTGIRQELPINIWSYALIKEWLDKINVNFVNIDTQI